MKYINIIIILFLFSCSQDEILDKDSFEDLTRAMDFFQKLDQEIPGPNFPGLDKQYKVVKATKHGLLELENGRIIALAGLKCDHKDLKKYLDGTLVKDKNMKIVFSPSGLEINNHILAYVWEVSESIDPSYSDVDFSNLLNQPSETALSSQWCKPIRQDKHDYHLRYTEIAAFKF